MGEPLSSLSLGKGREKIKDKRLKDKGVQTC